MNSRVCFYEVCAPEMETSMSFAAFALPNVAIEMEPRTVIAAYENQLQLDDNYYLTISDNYYMLNFNF